MSDESMTPRTDKLNATFSDAAKTAAYRRMQGLAGNLERELSYVESRVLALQAERDKAEAVLRELIEAEDVILDYPHGECAEDSEYDRINNAWSAARALLKEHGKNG